MTPESGFGRVSEPQRPVVQLGPPLGAGVPPPDVAQRPDLGSVVELLGDDGPDELPRREPAVPLRRPLDVSGRPLRLRDVDIDAFLHPKTIAVIGASEQSAKPNTAMTRKF
ncbi:MAG: hypothetical protein ACXW2C_03070, partial [Acidimicrobiia bacterium]